MYGKITYRACTIAAFKSDLARFIGGADMATLATFNAALSTKAGEASTWSLLDAATAVISAKDASGMDKVYQLSGAAAVLQAISMESWAAGVVLNPTLAAGSCPFTATGGVVFYVVTPDSIALYGNADTQLTLLCELSRETSALKDRSSACVLTLSSSLAVTMPRIKHPSAAGDQKPSTALGAYKIMAAAAFMLGDGEEPIYCFADLVFAYGGIPMGRLRGVLNEAGSTHNPNDVFIFQDASKKIVVGGYSTTFRLLVDMR